ncbi:hypothetical protein [Xylanimonas protaetiae]|uniref:Uncharacterized protein n=1 Tax=Xylanimonas protaetiae TaxID=2509457 RepID=A0A4V0YG54_9MICO|nr:hypothetical protein [Xylanimonas protaetiae]QAY70021.1 hypothetical protein ET471_08225 [Xylanimonas protaetiae]
MSHIHANDGDVTVTTVRSLATRAYPSVKNDDRSWSPSQIDTYTTIEHKLGATFVHVRLNDDRTLILPIDEATTLRDNITLSLADAAALDAAAGTAGARVSPIAA